MKRFLNLIVVLALFFSGATGVWAARSFIVSYAPKRCTPLYKGHYRHLIRWRSSGGSPIQGPVNILLIPKSGRSIIIATGVWNNGQGQYGWGVPGNIPDGEYKIRVVLAGDSQIYGETAFFEVSSVPHRAELITVTEPPFVPQGTPYGYSGRRVCYKGTRSRVRWSIECGIDGSQARASIYLVSEHGLRSFTLATDARIGYGLYNFITIPRNIPSGRYRIKIETVDRRIWGQGKPFEVVDLPSVSITSPRAGSVLYVGRSYHITWQTVEVSNPATVRIYLIQGNKKRRLYQGPNNHDFLWKVGYRDVGTYTLRIEVLNYRIHDEISNIAVKFPTIKGPGHLGSFDKPDIFVKEIALERGYGPRCTCNTEVTIENTGEEMRIVDVIVQRQLTVMKGTPGTEQFAYVCRVFSDRLPGDFERRYICQFGFRRPPKRAKRVKIRAIVSWRDGKGNHRVARVKEFPISPCCR
ncbi:GPI anchored serine-threonine rich family protein [Thermosulfurimonas sp. F29]|uniref:GPI anchored serine-threonine rich family protein n=1 Tax=Thermosulfurimonas sp. F29 TaxID=2867247 RepID=UPI001C8376D8|nr:GPI anchored serine-threonine rich family protein [Thermosulfurimonas sp. F29]MBX6423526.1 GPI anchored serine-threonine rich family protein [Thermosulfurimonas sp. F29]